MTAATGLAVESISALEQDTPAQPSPAETLRFPHRPKASFGNDRRERCVL